MVQDQGNRGDTLPEKGGKRRGFGGSSRFWGFFAKSEKRPIEAHHCEEKGQKCTQYDLLSPQKKRRKLLGVIPFFGHKYTACGFDNCGHKKPPFYRRPMFMLFAAFMAFEIGMGVTAYKAMDQETKPQSPGQEAVRIVDAHPTSSAQYVRELAQRFGRPYEDMAIFYTDPDRLAALRALNPAANDYQTQIGAIQALIKQDTGIDVSRYIGLAANQIRDMNGISALPIQLDELFAYGTESGDPAVDKLCIITPVAELTDGVHWISQLSQIPANALRDLGREKGAVDVSPDVMARFIDYHETTHCQDRRWVWSATRVEIVAARAKIALAKMRRGQLSFDDPDRVAWQDYAYIVHQAEMLADVNAALMVAQEGHTEMASKIADARASYSYIIGPAAARTDMYAGAIYYTTPGLRAAQKLIDEKGAEGLKKLSMDDLMQISYRIVEENRLSRPAFDKLVQQHLQDDPSLIRRLKKVMLGTDVAPQDEDLHDWYQETTAAIRHIADKNVLFGPNGPPQMRMVLAWDALAARALQKAQADNISPAESLVREVTAFKDRVRQELRTGRPLDVYEAALYPQIDALFAAHVKRNKLAPRDAIQLPKPQDASRNEAPAPLSRPYSTNKADRSYVPKTPGM